MGWNPFRRPKAPKVRKYQGNQAGGASAGIGIGSTKNPNLSPENVQKWRTLTGDEIENFLYNGMLLPVHSTNVAAMQYHIENSKLMIEYHDGSAYLYSDISEDEAMAFLQAPSKGAAVWDRLRVRGTSTGAKKQFVKLR